MQKTKVRFWILSAGYWALVGELLFFSLYHAFFGPQNIRGIAEYEELAVSSVLAGLILGAVLSRWFMGSKKKGLLGGILLGFFFYPVTLGITASLVSFADYWAREILLLEVFQNILHGATVLVIVPLVVTGMVVIPVCAIAGIVLSWFGKRFLEGIPK
ncbi:MAG: hypothetical protein JW893_00985 [Candidatus Omnitrophica bacterium]|nr:hypothetical protein [Candidatus Omnitrophota bacterium]